MKPINKEILFNFVLICSLKILTVASKDTSWDELKFTQEWGYSECRQFKDQADGASNSQRKCRFEGEPSIWTIHGVWPTKEGSEGPNFCKSVKFDVTALTPILEDLNRFWYEIDGTKDAHNFWKHEWTKHGSCAMELEIFDTELKYFSEALALRKKLDLKSILQSGGITPNGPQGYFLKDIQKAFQEALGTQSAIPYVQCVTLRNEQGASEHHMLAIEVCLDKTLNILDCSKKSRYLDMEELKRDQVGPCPTNEPILYEDYTSDKSTTPKRRNKSLKPYFSKHLPMSSKAWNKLWNLKHSKASTFVLF